MTYAFYHTEPHLSTSTQSITELCTNFEEKRTKQTNTKKNGERHLKKDYAWLENTLEDIRYEINSRSAEIMYTHTLLNTRSLVFFQVSITETQTNNHLALL